MIVTTTKSLDQVAGLGATIQWDGKTLELSPLRVIDSAEFDSYIRQRQIESIQRAGRVVGVPPIEQSNAVAAIAKAVVTQDERIAFLQTVDGIRYLVWRSLLKKNPRAKIADLDDMSMQDLTAIFDIVDSLAGERGAEGKAAT